MGKTEDAGEHGRNNLQLTRLGCGWLRVWENRGSGARGWRAHLPGNYGVEEMVTWKVVGQGSSEGKCS